MKKLTLLVAMVTCLMVTGCSAINPFASAPADTPDPNTVGSPIVEAPIGEAPIDNTDPAALDGAAEGTVETESPDLDSLFGGADEVSGALESVGDSDGIALESGFDNIAGLADDSLGLEQPPAEIDLEASQVITLEGSDPTIVAAAPELETTTNELITPVTVETTPEPAPEPAQVVEVTATGGDANLDKTDDRSNYLLIVLGLGVTAFFLSRLRRPVSQ